jgi:hypothetical protein
MILIRVSVTWGVTAGMSHPDPRMEPLSRCKLGPAIAGQLVQHHDAPPAPYLSPGLGGGLQRNTTHHTTPSIGNISTLRPFTLLNPSSIVVSNDSSLPITSVCDSILPRPFYLNNILLAPHMVESLLSIHRVTTDNRCSMEFDLFGLSVKDLTTKNAIVMSNTTVPLYMMRLPESLTPTSSDVAAIAAVPHTLIVVAPITWHRRLGHPGTDTLSSLSRSSFIQCTSNLSCMSVRQTHQVTLCSSSHRVEHDFDLIHLDL